MSFEPRNTKPAPTNKYYISSRYDGKRGYNPCILGNAKTRNGRDTYLNVLPNCVGWAVGRFNEIIGNNNCDYLYIIGANNNAKNLVNNAKKQGLEVGTIPKLGAAIVWTGGQYGHVAIVESISKDGEHIRVSQSGWNYNGVNHMWFATHAKGGGDWINGDDYSWMASQKLKLAGFIYQPEGEDMSYEAFCAYMARYEKEQREKPVSPWAAESVNKAHAAGIMKGDEKGNIMPHSPVTRQEWCVLADRLGEL